MKIEIQKASNTYAYTLHAIGLASLLSELMGQRARLRDEGATISVFCDEGQPPDQWHPPSPGFLFIWRSSKDGPRPNGQTIDYETQQKIAEGAVAG
ncbi:MAG: hypothetical protein NTU79_02645 [Planctomycetota bacterium]|nr:hypothetical protein [Planctomycetota bacterium]